MNSYMVELIMTLERENRLTYTFTTGIGERLGCFWESPLWKWPGYEAIVQVNMVELTIESTPNHS